MGKVERYSEGVYTNDVGGMGGQRRKGSEWWSEEVGVEVADNLRKGYREEIGIRLTGTGHRVLL